METRLVKSILAVLFVCAVCADAVPIDVNIYGDTTISGGEYGTVNIYDSLDVPPIQTTVTMTGGSAESVWTYDSSIFNMQDGNILGWITLRDSSNLTMTGGTVNDLELYNSTVAILSGGNITGTIGVGPGSSAIVHVYGKNFDHTPLGPNGWSLTGDWANNNSFTIFFRTSEPFPGTHLILHTIPEPCTLGLFGLGIFLMRRKTKPLHK